MGRSPHQPEGGMPSQKTGDGCSNGGFWNLADLSLTVVLPLLCLWYSLFWGIQLPLDFFPSLSEMYAHVSLTSTEKAHILSSWS